MNRDIIIKTYLEAGRKAMVEDYLKLRGPSFWIAYADLSDNELATVLANHIAYAVEVGIKTGLEKP